MYVHCDSSWWLHRIHVWMGWIWTSYWALQFFRLFCISSYMSGLVSCYLKTSLFWFNRYFPFGVDGILHGSATVFFAYVGFGAVATLPKRYRQHSDSSLSCYLYLYNFNCRCWWTQIFNKFYLDYNFFFREVVT
jgi:hypothetical protein